MTDQTNAVSALTFGHTWSDVPATRCAWGARWIFPDDQVHDRTDRVGSPEDWQELYTWLKDTVKGTPFDKARDLRYEMAYGEGADRPHVLYEDDEGKFVGHPHGQSGYLYVVAWLKRHESEQA